MNNHEHILLRYINALENGDVAVLTEIWQLAENDSRLTQDLLELNQEMGEPIMSHPVVYNGQVKPLPPHQTPLGNGHRAHSAQGWPLHLPTVKTKRHTRAYRRVAVLLILILGALGIMFALTPKNDPVRTVPIFGITPTFVPPEDLVPITTDNADQLVEVNRVGKGTVEGAFWSPDGSQVIAYGTYIWVYDAADLINPMNVIDVDFYADFAALGDNAGSLVIGNKDGRAYHVNLATEEKQELPKLENTSDLARYGNLVARAQQEPTFISVWDLAQGREIYVLHEMDNTIIEVTFSPDGQMVGAAGSFNKANTPSTYRQEQVKFWDLSTGENTISLDIDDPVFLTGLAISTDGRYVTAAGEGYLFQWDLLNMSNSLPILSKGYESDYRGYYFSELFASPDNARIIAINRIGVGFNSEIVSFDASDLTLLDTMSINDAQSVAFNPVDARVLYATDRFLYTVDGLELAPPILPHKAFNQPYLGVDVVDEFMLYYTQFEVVVKNLVTDEIVATWDEPINSIKGALFISDSRIVIYGAFIDPSNNYSRKIIYWDFLTGEEEDHWAGNTDMVALDYDVASEQIAHLNNGEFWVQDAISDTVLGHFTIRENFWQMNWSVSVVYHPQGGIVAVSGWNRRIYLYDTTQNIGHQDDYVALLTGHSDLVTTLAFANGDSLVSIDKAGNLIVWNTSTWEEIGFTTFNHEYLESVAISPDNSIIAVTSDTQIYLVDTATLEIIKTFTGHAATITDLEFTPDGRQIMTSSEDGTVRSWGVPQE